MKTPAADLISAHLNAPFGAVVSAFDVRRSFEKGCLDASSDQANAVLATLFTEIEPRLLAQCAVESGVSLLDADRLYQDALKHHAHRCPEWELVVESFS